MRTLEEIRQRRAALEEFIENDVATNTTAFHLQIFGTPEFNDLAVWFAIQQSRLAEEAVALLKEGSAICSQHGGCDAVRASPGVIRDTVDALITLRDYVIVCRDNLRQVVYDVVARIPLESDTDSAYDSDIRMNW